MQFENFKEVSLQEWTEYLRWVYASQVRGQVTPRELILLYPTMLVCSRTPDHYIMELLGVTPVFSSLSVKSHGIDSTNRYFNQFNTPGDSISPALNLNGKEYIEFFDLIVSNDIRQDETSPRLRSIDTSKYATIMYGQGGAIHVPAETDKITFQNCLFVNCYSSALRIKHILQAELIRPDTTEHEYRSFLRALFSNKKHIYGILHCDRAKESEYFLAGQFANIFLFPVLRETSIGEFIRQHPEFAKKAFHTRHFLYEPHLTWCYKPKPTDEEAINPDLVVQREDGFYDIYDLKTAALTKHTVTKGKRSRRRFIDYIEEGVAQLAHYEEYFQYPENRQHALERYGIRLSAPRLCLVAGNLENVNKEQVDEACRRLRNFALLDYDTLLSMYYQSI